MAGTIDPNFLRWRPRRDGADGTYEFTTSSRATRGAITPTRGDRHICTFRCSSGVHAAARDAEYFPGDPPVPYDPIYQATPPEARERLISHFDGRGTRPDWRWASRSTSCARPGPTPMEEPHDEDPTRQLTTVAGRSVRSPPDRAVAGRPTYVPPDAAGRIVISGRVSTAETGNGLGDGARRGHGRRIRTSLRPSGRPQRTVASRWWLLALGGPRPGPTARTAIRDGQRAGCQPETAVWRHHIWMCRCSPAAARSSGGAGSISTTRQRRIGRPGGFRVTRTRGRSGTPSGGSRARRFPV